MPRCSVPKYRRNPNGQAFVYHASIPTKSHRKYLGVYNSPESKKKYQQFLARLEMQDQLQSPALPLGYVESISDLVLLYDDYAKSYYSEEGKPTKEYVCMTEALDPLDGFYGDLHPAQFGPRLLVQIQQHMAKKLSRGVVNNRTARIKRFWKWACKMEYAPSEIYSKLRCVGGLTRGEYGVRELPDVAPVPKEHVEALLPFLSPVVGAMVRVQYLCGMRPGETCNMQAKHLHFHPDIWLYIPPKHKNAYRGQVLVKAIVPSAQEILRPFLEKAGDGYLFKPEESDRWHRERRPTKPEGARKTPVYPSELRQRARLKAERAATPRKRLPRERFSTDSYHGSIDYAFERAKKAGVIVPHWTPAQLRHAISTRVSQELNQQAAQRWLGHKNLSTTDIYTEAQISELLEIASKLNLTIGG